LLSKGSFYSSFGEEERHEERFQTWQAVLFHWSIQLFDGGFDGVRQTTVEIGFFLSHFVNVEADGMTDLDEDFLHEKMFTQFETIRQAQYTQKC
jgi:hypothetical protein